MFRYKKIIAIVPARGESKRIPGKNIAKLNGKPLISYSIKQGKKSKLVDRVIVSSDDEKILSVAKKYGAETIKRPKKLAQDKTPTAPVLVHVLEELEKENYYPDIVVILQPTTPLRSVKDIDNSIKMIASGKADSTETFFKSTQHPFYMCKIRKDKTISLLDKRGNTERSQNFPEVYSKAGVVFTVKAKILKKTGSFYTKRHKAIIIPIERAVDIDEKADFKLAEIYLKYLHK